MARLSGWFMGLALPGNQEGPLRAGLWLTGLPQPPAQLLSLLQTVSVPTGASGLVVGVVLAEMIVFSQCLQFL